MNWPNRKFVNIWGEKTKIGEGTRIGEYVEIGNAIIGKNCMIQAFCFLCEGVTLEDDVFLGPRVTTLNDTYPPSYGKHWKETLIKRGASIGGGATILPGVIIGENSVVGAGSLVTKNIPENEVWVGVPARFLKRRET